MDLKNVFIILADNITKNDVVDIIIDEGYIDNFVFGGNLTPLGWQKHMFNCDEIWLFGDELPKGTISREQYKFALSNNMDIWQMA